jgi:hypothetical protein
VTPALWLQTFPSAAAVHEQMNFGNHEIMNSSAHEFMKRVVIA